MSLKCTRWMRVRCHAPVKSRKAVTEGLTPPVLHKWMQAAKKKTYFHNNFVDGSNGQAHTSRLKPVLKIFVWQKKKKNLILFGFSCFGEGGAAMETGARRASSSNHCCHNFVAPLLLCLRWIPPHGRDQQRDEW